MRHLCCKQEEMTDLMSTTSSIWSLLGQEKKKKVPGHIVNRIIFYVSGANVTELMVDGITLEYVIS